MTSTIRPASRAAARLFLQSRVTVSSPSFRNTQSPRSHSVAARLYSSSSETPRTPAFMQTIKTDLKTAMRAKDAPRLAVLRTLINAVNHAAKTDRPVETDAQLVALIRKSSRASREAADEAVTAGRQDLADAEEARIALLDEYARATGVKELAYEDLLVVVKGVVTALEAEGQKIQIGTVMRSLLSGNGPLQGQEVDKSVLSMAVKEVLGS